MEEEFLAGFEELAPFAGEAREEGLLVSVEAEVQTAMARQVLLSSPETLRAYCHSPGPAVVDFAAVKRRCG